MNRLLRNVLAVAVIGTAIAAVGPSPVQAAGATYTCDATHPNTEFRWPIKSLSDANNHAVDYHAIHTTVARLRAFHRPSIRVRDGTPRIGQKERNTYSVRARVARAKLENDGDVILIVAVPNHVGRTIALEVGNPRCVTDSFKRRRIRLARRAILRGCGPLDSSFTTLRGQVRVRGVGYWDRSSSEAYASPNAFQLWPVLGFRGNCTQH